MNAKEIQQKMDRFHYWDARLLKLEANYFSDEILLEYLDPEDGNVIYEFKGCYHVLFDHVKGYTKDMPAKSFSIPQIPYFVINVEVKEDVIEGKEFYSCKMNLFPLYVDILCEHIEVYRKKELLAEYREGASLGIG